MNRDLMNVDICNSSSFRRFFHGKKCDETRPIFITFALQTF